LTRSVDGLRKLHLAIDAIGLLLAAALALWILRSQSVSGGDGRPIVLLLSAAAVAFTAARYLGSLGRLWVPAAVILWAGFMFVQFPKSILSTSPVGAPFGYANAKGAFFALAAVAALTLVVRGPLVLSFAAAAVTASCLAVPFISRSYAAGVLVIGIALVSLLVAAVLGWRWSVFACALMFAAALIVTLVLGATHGSPRSERLERVIDATLTERRPLLWSEAIDLLKEHPTFGVGPGRFREESPTARSDVDAQWAHHGFLQIGAETGYPGLVLSVALFMWGFVRLGVGRRDGVSAMGAVALAVLGIHACMEYVLHFATLPIISSALVGSASARGPLEYELTEWELETFDEVSVART
jgi:O-antigen ligase